MRAIGLSVSFYSRGKCEKNIKPVCNSTGCHIMYIFCGYILKAQNMTGHRDLLINEQKAFCKCQYLYICNLKKKIRK